MIKKHYKYLKVFLVTLTFGLMSVFQINGSLYYNESIAVDLPKVKSAEIITIITKRNWNGFALFAQACGGRNIYGGTGSETVYDNNSFRRVSVSSSYHDKIKDTKSELELRIIESLKVLENRNNRYILEYSKDNENWIEIITFYDENTLKILYAPDLELGLEFEKWLKENNLY